MVTKATSCAMFSFIASRSLRWSDFSFFCRLMCSRRWLLGRSPCALCVFAPLREPCSPLHSRRPGFKIFLAKSQRRKGAKHRDAVQRWAKSSGGIVGQSPPKELIKFQKPYDREIRDLALNLRALVLEEMAPCYENIYDAYSAVAIGYGTSDRLRDGIFHIAVYSSHVNLGFNWGATLDDPDGVLEGSGKQIRHITIKSIEDIKRPELRAYIRRAKKKALADARKLGETPPKKPDGVISTVKAIYAKKR